MLINHENNIFRYYKFVDNDKEKDFMIKFIMYFLILVYIFISNRDSDIRILTNFTLYDKDKQSINKTADTPFYSSQNGFGSRYSLEIMKYQF